MNPYTDDLISFEFVTNIMKTVLKFISYALFAGIVIFISCSKNSSNREAPPAPQAFLDTLTGREFEFNDLIWREIAGLGTSVMVEVDRPDLFSNSFRVLKIKIRLDTSAIWLDVPHSPGYPYPGGFNFFYFYGGDDFFTVNGRLYIFPNPANPSLKGTKASIRVKFI